MDRESVVVMARSAVSSSEVTATPLDGSLLSVVVVIHCTVYVHKYYREGDSKKGGGVKSGGSRKRERAKGVQVSTALLGRRCWWLL